MTKLRITSKTNPYMILAPANAVIPDTFQRLTISEEQHATMLARMQIMRGGVALAEGAIRPSQLDEEKRHRMPGDEDSWHILRVGPDGSIKGCVRILEHQNLPRFSTLRLAKSALAQSKEWRSKLQAVVESEVEQADRRGAKLVEPGGWVLEEALRGSQEAVSIALSAFAWSQLVGDRLGYVTATVKHESSSMLRRLGASGLNFEGEDFPKYYDPEYQCEMEVLKFETAGLNSRFEARMAPLRALLANSPVVQTAVKKLALARLAA